MKESQKYWKVPRKYWERNRKVTVKYETSNSTFEERGVLSVNLEKEARIERGELPVNSEKEANWVPIQRKRQINCHFEERVDQHPIIFHPTSLSL